MKRSLLPLSLLILLLPALLSQQAAAQSNSASPQSLNSNQTLQVEIKEGVQHRYQVYAVQGQLLRIAFSSADVLIQVMIVSDPADFKHEDSLLKLPATGRVLYLAEKTGWQIFCVNRRGKKEQQGRYELSVKVIATPKAEEIAEALAQHQHSQSWELYYRGTEESLMQVISKGEETLKVWRQLQDRYQEAKTLYQLGEAYKAKEQFPAALTAFQAALTYFRTENIARHQAIILTSIGQIYATWSDYAQAIEYYRQALPLWRQGDEEAQINMIGWNLLNLGHVYRAYGEWDKAMEYYQQAYQCYEQYPLTSSSTERPRGIGIVEGNLGSISLARGDKQTALTYLRQAVEHFKQGQNAENEYAMYGRVGDVFSSLGEYEQARSSYEQSLKYYRQTKSLAEATILNSYGNLHRLTGNYEQAIEKLSRALSIRRELGDRRGQALTLTNLGAVYAAQRQYEQALHAYGEAQALWKEIGDRYSQAYTLNYLGLVHYEMKEAALAREYFEQALALRRATHDREGEANTLYNLARLNFDAGDFQAAHQAIASVIALSETVRATVSSDDLRAAYLATIRDYYEFYVEVLMQMHRREPTAGYHIEAFKISEMARARSLLDSLTDHHVNVRQDAARSLLEKEQALQQRLNAKAEYQRALQRAKASAELAQAAEQEIQTIISEIKEVRSQIKSASPRYGELTQFKSLGLAEVQKSILDENTVLLAYALGKERSYLWFISRDELTSYELPRREVIEDAARQVYSLLNLKDTPSDTEQLNRALTALSCIVLSPVAEKLKQQRLLIVADGALQYVPFAVLPEPRDEGGGMKDENKASLSSHPLIVRHEIVALPSATLLLALRREAQQRSVPKQAIAVIADPVFDSEDVRVAMGKSKASQKLADAASELKQSLREVGETGLARLPFTRREADEIALLVPEPQRKIALDFAAQREIFLQANLSEYRILHIATHGLLNSTHPELSGLVFSLVDKNGKPKDGFLRLHEIYNLKLNADLIVLSACQTALGKEIRGEGLIGLTRGFMYAGASRVIASLWKVNDKATAELMKVFYQELLGEKKQSPAAALRAAQLTLLKQKRWEHPSYWAAFALQGDWQ